MTTTDDATARPRSRPARRRGLVLLLGALLLSSCTYRSGQQMEVDYLGSRYRFYIYEKPSWLLLGLRDVCKKQAGTGTERWGRCSLTYLRDHVSVPAVGAVDWNHFTEGGRWADYASAIGDVGLGARGTDSSGQTYVTRCLTGDHPAFGSYNWTYRTTSDAHCKRGSYPS
ncbi:hypothetical protein KSP35_12540 [Aquihabitans sp. G128]|uniref:hypothetical protein n=1 Tax=Aquihabitans sp. G128 TaxID=2849779 RepID=UPI001C23327B|nr:hypothetical protein [Aquihabitans sp. G128]QXC59236.1 hypothetical protein KSP35_12540 [Aquihabitans sp. G128]